MAARESAAVLAALADHLAGMKVLTAAKKHDVAPQSIHRAKRRRKLPYVLESSARRYALRGGVGAGDVGGDGES
jgi:hypothetical protein